MTSSKKLKLYNKSFPRQSPVLQVTTLVTFHIPLFFIIFFAFICVLTNKTICVWDFCMYFGTHTHTHTHIHQGFSGGSDGKQSTHNMRYPGSNPWIRKIPWKRKWQPTPVFLPGESHGQRSLVGYGPRGCKVRHN